MIKKFGSYMLEAIAAASAFFTIISVLFDITFTCIGAVVTLSAIIGIAVGYACDQTRSKKKVILHMQPQLTLTIEQGDLFKQRGIILIPVNDYFDTHVGDGVISEKTIHGLFINTYFKDRIEELDSKIEKALQGESVIETNKQRKLGKQKRYKLGTCATIRDGENAYVLFAFTRFDENNIASIERDEYAVVINDVFKYLESMCEYRQVFIPLMGTGLSRINLPAQQVLHYLVDTIQFMPSTKIPAGVHMEIKSLSGSNVSLNMIEEIFNTSKFV